MESSHDPRPLIGLGTADLVTKLTVRWPSGAVTTREHLKVDQRYQIIELSGGTR
jgi:enediyne biosynthesis protein E4